MAISNYIDFFSVFIFRPLQAEFFTYCWGKKNILKNLDFIGLSAYLFYSDTHMKINKIFIIIIKIYFS
jgi:hypothetical protein